jgi:sec-independent protein translocase protein TatA
MPFGLHLPELIIVLVVALLVFGPKKLPEMGSAIGKSIKEFRKGMHELSGPDTKSVELRSPRDTFEEPGTPAFSAAEVSPQETPAYAGEEVSTNRAND